MNEQSTKMQSTLRNLPSVDALIKTKSARAIENEIGAEHLTLLARGVIESLRAGLLSEEAIDSSREGLLMKAEEKLSALFQKEERTGVKRVINASGVIVHTNLGRAPLSPSARRAIVDEASRYCALEYDLETGRRGRRGSATEELLKELTGAEDAIVVNNCAAAALLILTALAKGGEVIVSRGELVEIGGDFRVPDVMAQSGARLVEVGTTNRTKLSDYESAITENTRVVMRVHPSNYRVIGFTAVPSLEELARLSHEKGLPLYEDAGSGALIDLKPYGLDGEPTIGESIANGADIVSFSGDKLLGSVQAGLIVGRSEYVNRLRKFPMYRALRADKIAYAALEATLKSYLRGNAAEEIPVLRMLALDFGQLNKRANVFVKRLKKNLSANGLSVEITEGESAIGGGSAPTTHPRTALVLLKHSALTANELEEKLRRNSPPIITRIVDDCVAIDLRTVFEEDEAELVSALVKLDEKQT
jgi:L-seryl-tRNA(Ser) seleniumtransferase